MHGRLSEMTVELITIKQAALALNVSVSTVRNMLQRGELPALRVGRQIRFVREDLEHWVRRRVQARASQRSAASQGSMSQSHIPRCGTVSPSPAFRGIQRAATI